MAKIVYGSLAGAISGSVGNETFSHGRYGAYIRRRVIPTKAFNIYTLKSRNILTICSRGWGGMDPDVQQAWNTWAQSHPITDRLGQKQTLFGAGAYNELNARLMNAGDGIIDVPPIAAPPAPLTTLTAVADASAHTCILTTAPSPLGAANQLWVQVALTNSPGVNYNENLFKLVTISGKNQATGLGIGAALELRFGTLLELEKYTIRVSVFSSVTGLLSGPKNFSGAVVA